jgi:hypothetical protein
LIIYNLLSILTATSCGLTAYLTTLSLRLWKGNGGLGRRLEGSYALIGGGWTLATGMILWFLFTLPSSLIPVVAPFNPKTTAFLFGLAASSVGLMRLLRPTVDRVVAMESDRQSGSKSTATVKITCPES